MTINRETIQSTYNSAGLSVCDPMNWSLPGSSVNEILQARIPEWVSIPFSRRSSQPRDRIWVSPLASEPPAKPSLILQ